MHDATPDAGHAKDGHQVPQGARVPPLSRDRVIPGRRVGAFCEVFLVLEDETSGLDGIDCIGAWPHVRDSIAALDSETDGAVFLVGLVEAIRHDPLVDAEGAAWFQDAEDLFVDALKRWGVHGGLDGIDGVEGVLWEVDVLLVMSLWVFVARGGQVLTIKSPLTNDTK